MKHVESRIENAQLIDGSTVPVWLINDGLVSVFATLTYTETGEILIDIAKWANILQDPLSAPGKLNENG